MGNDFNKFINPENHFIGLKIINDELKNKYDSDNDFKEKTNLLYENLQTTKLIDRIMYIFDNDTKEKNKLKKLTSVIDNEIKDTTKKMINMHNTIRDKGFEVLEDGLNSIFKLLMSNPYILLLLLLLLLFAYYVFKK